MRNTEEILSELGGGRILDVATGSGSFISILLDAVKAYDEVIGIDSSEKNAGKFADTFRGKPVHFKQMNAEAMTFPDAAFDTVCLANSMHHMANLQAVFSEMLRVLKPGGSFVLAEMYCDGQTDQQMTHVLLHHWWAAVDCASGIFHHETFTRQQILDLLTTTGIQDWRTEDVSFMETDPRDPEMVHWLEGVIDQYIQRASSLTSSQKLINCGEDLRQRLRTVGFHSAAALVADGRKN